MEGSANLSSSYPIPCVLRVPWSLAITTLPLQRSRIVSSSVDVKGECLEL